MNFVALDGLTPSDENFPTLLDLLRARDNLDHAVQTGSPLLTPEQMQMLVSFWDSLSEFLFTMGGVEG